MTYVRKVEIICFVHERRAHAQSNRHLMFVFIFYSCQGCKSDKQSRDRKSTSGYFHKFRKVLEKDHSGRTVKMGSYYRMLLRILTCKTWNM